MSDRELSSLGQRANAARAHRLLGYVFVAFAILKLIFARPAAAGDYIFIVLFNGALALGNFQVAAAAWRDISWARGASLVMAVLLLPIGGMLVFGGGMTIAGGQGGAEAAYGQIIGSMFGVAVVIAGVYILLNSNWRQPVPPDEKPDSSTRP